MRIYKVVRGASGGGVRYLKSVETGGHREDGTPRTKAKFIGKKDIPANVLRLLDGGQDIVDDAGMDLEAPLKECIFCGVGCTMFRLVNMQTVYLCEEHYYSTNIGQIAQRLREVSNGQESTQA